MSLQKKIEYKEKSFTGAPVIVGKILQTEDTEVISQISKEVSRNLVQEILKLKKQHPNVPADIKIQYGQYLLAQELMQKGMFCHSLYLVGNVAKSFEISQNWTTSGSFEQYNLELRRFSNPEHIREIVALHKNSFEEKFGWFLTKESFLKKLKTDLEMALNEKHEYWLLFQESKIVGFFGGDFKDLNCKEAGTVLVLEKFLQGKKLSRAVYKFYIEQLHKRETFSYTGGTSQPAVLKLGKELNRKAEYWIFGDTQFFPFEYFCGY